MFRQYFRGVIWPRKPENGLHRYVVIGMLVTDKPIPELEGNEIVLDGSTFALAEILADIRQTEKNPYLRGLTANQLLTRLGVLTDEDQFGWEPEKEHVG